MDSVWRAAAIYIGLMIIMRLSGKRSLAQITTFDFVLLLDVLEHLQDLPEQFQLATGLHTHFYLVG